MTQQTTLTTKEEEYFKELGFIQRETHLNSEILIEQIKNKMIHTRQIEDIGFKIITISFINKRIYIKRIE